MHNIPDMNAVVRKKNTTGKDEKKKVTLFFLNVFRQSLSHISVSTEPRGSIQQVGHDWLAYPAVWTAGNNPPQSNQ